MPQQKDITTGINLDRETLRGFGKEWSRFDQKALSDSERQEVFRQYFSLIDWNWRPARALDMGCGSGRWAALAAPLVENLVAADASAEALAVARANVTNSNVSFVQCTPETLPFPENYFDFIFSLGVLHHIPDTQGGVRSLVAKLAPGGTLLLYLYYAFDNRPAWFRYLWKVSDLVRRCISRLPFPVRSGFSELIAIFVYWPLARIAKYVKVPASWPLRYYADRSFYFMRTDALDRFGTRLEQRFTRKQIVAMLESCGLGDIKFSDGAPFWVCKATKPAH